MRPRMRARRDAQETLVGIGGFSVTLEARGHLSEVEMIVRLVLVDEGGATQAG